MKEKLYSYLRVSTKVQEEELIHLEDIKKSLVQEIDDLDNQKESVDWISKYGDDISKQFEKPTSELLEGIINKIIVSPVLGETREGKDTQRGHILNIKFKLSIVNDGIEYNNDRKKSDGYSIVHETKNLLLIKDSILGVRVKKIHQI